MAKNDVILIDSIIDDRIEQKIPSNDRGEVFEYFVFEQLLKDYDLSNEELMSGWVDGRDDGGIDGFYIFINGHLLLDSENFNWPKVGCVLEICLITCKHHDTFQQAPLDNLVASLSELFDFSLENKDLQGDYSSQILHKRDLLKKAYKQVSGKLSEFNIFFTYASRGNSKEIGDSINSRSNQIKQVTKDSFANCNVEFYFTGSSELIELNRKTPIFTLELPFSGNLSSGEAYILLAKLSDYYNFITDDGRLRKYLFDSNVRDFMGMNRVNEDIKNTLLNENSPDFRRLNNGITILATGANIVGQSILVRDIQIVNGLQTSEGVFRYFSNGGIDEKNRSILVKVIVTNSSENRDEIIRATNNQTVVELSALHATDKIQRDIEEVLKLHNIYYERRPNYYKNQGISIEEILTPLYLASGYVSLLLKSPQKATSLKSNFMRDENKYNKVFSEKEDLKVWPKVAYILKKTDDFLDNIKANEKNRSESFESFNKHRRHYLSFLTMSMILGDFAFNSDALIKFDISNFTIIELGKGREILKRLYPQQSRKRKINPEAFISLCEELSKNRSINGFEKLKYSYGINSTPVIHKRKETIDENFIHKIHSILPEQPWKPGIDQEIRKLLNCTHKDYSIAVNTLIKRGLRFKQENGVVYDHDGNVIKIDTERVDPKTLKLK